MFEEEYNKYLNIDPSQSKTIIKRNDDEYIEWLAKSFAFTILKEKEITNEYHVGRFELSALRVQVLNRLDTRPEIVSRFMCRVNELVGYDTFPKNIIDKNRK